MIVKIQKRWPFVQRIPPASSAGQNPVADSRLHRSWVMTPGGRGWTLRHDVDGWTVQLDHGGVAKYPLEKVENIPPPDDIQ